MTVKQTWSPASSMRPRFRTEADALKYLDCIQHHKPIPEEIWVWPYLVSGNYIVPNPEYSDAPFESMLIPSL